MALVKDGRIVADDWRKLADDEAVPIDDSPVLVSFARWFKERATLETRNAPLGLYAANNDPVERLNGSVNRFEVVALEFPKFTDGRAYSQARILRERLRYVGELRATGNVLRDQLLFMKRAGFDAFDMANPVTGDVYTKAIASFPAFYQPAADGQVSILRRRLLERQAAS